MNTKNFLIVIITLLIIIAGGFYYVNQEKSNLSQEPVLQTPITQPVVELTIPDTYATTSNWPPELAESTNAYSCKQVEFSEGTVTTEKVVNGTTYCVQNWTEGAAGSTYDTYVYTKATSVGTKITTFDFRFVQCQNYDEDLMQVCKKTQTDFKNQLNEKLDTVIDQLMQ